MLELLEGKGLAVHYLVKYHIWEPAYNEHGPERYNLYLGQIIVETPSIDKETAKLLAYRKIAPNAIVNNVLQLGD